MAIRGQHLCETPEMGKLTREQIWCLMWLVCICPRACFKLSAFVTLKHGDTLHLDFDVAESRAERQRQASRLLSLQTSASESEPCSSRSVPVADPFWWQREQDVAPLPEAACCQRAPLPIVLRLVTGHSAHPHGKLLDKVKSCCNFSLGSGERPPVLTVTRRDTTFQYG